MEFGPESFQGHAFRTWASLLGRMRFPPEEPLPHALAVLAMLSAPAASPERFTTRPRRLPIRPRLDIDSVSITTRPLGPRDPEVLFLGHRALPQILALHPSKQPWNAGTAGAALMELLVNAAGCPQIHQNTQAQMIRRI